MEIESLHEIIGIVFNDSALLRQSMTHRSHANEHPDVDIDDNERLEYLGDAILDFITADMLYRRFPGMPEGEMTRVRAALVRTEALAQLANDCHLGEILIMGKGEAASGGRENLNNLCGAFEALIGAMYIDQGLEVVRDFVMPRLTTLQKTVMDEALRKDPRSRFQEWAQAIYGITPHFVTIDITGPEHEHIFTVQCFVGAHFVAEGQGRTKRAGAQDAARNALDLRDQGELKIPRASTKPPSQPPESDVNECE